MDNDNNIAIWHYSTVVKPRNIVFVAGIPKDLEFVEAFIQKHWRHASPDARVRTIISKAVDEWMQGWKSTWPAGLQKVLAGARGSGGGECLCCGGNMDLHHCFFGCVKVAGLARRWREEGGAPTAGVNELRALPTGKWIAASMRFVSDVHRVWSLPPLRVTQSEARQALGEAADAVVDTALCQNSSQRPRTPKLRGSLLHCAGSAGPPPWKRPCDSSRSSSCAQRVLVTTQATHENDDEEEAVEDISDERWQVHDWHDWRHWRFVTEKVQSFRDGYVQLAALSCGPLDVCCLVVLCTSITPWQDTFSSAQRILKANFSVGVDSLETVDSEVQHRISSRFQYIIKMLPKAFQREGGDWSRGHWTILSSATGQPAIGVGQNKIARERAASLGLALSKLVANPGTTRWPVVSDLVTRAQCVLRRSVPEARLTLSKAQRWSKATRRFASPRSKIKSKNVVTPRSKGRLQANR